MAVIQRDDEAEVPFRRAMEVDPEDGITLYRYGQFLLGCEGRELEAERNLRLAAELRPEDQEVQRELDRLLRERRAGGEAGP
jgi:Tfp pilus assembly protein PilF